MSVYYPKFYSKNPTIYNFNPELYGSYSQNLNMCEFNKPSTTPIPFHPNPTIKGDVSLCRNNNIIYKNELTNKPVYGGDATISFPNGLKYQDYPFFDPKLNINSGLRLTRPSSTNQCNYDMMLGF